ncbi:hypothetical protein [Micromonospora alfalfae]|nr:hypothetical protein [Micromonospora alfalfae]
MTLSIRWAIVENRRATAELEQPIEDRSLRLLTDEERRDVTYHRPGRLGDLLFNWFV